MSRPRSAAAAALLLLLAAPAAAQRPSAAAGAAGGRLGTLRFETSCRPEVAAPFDRAVALLHSFEFGASRRAFEEVLAADPACAVAHWGLALGHWGNPLAPGRRPAAQLEQGRAAASAADRIGMRATPRERAYVHAVARLFEDHARVDQSARVLAYEQAMAELVERFPADTEAAIFHALALTATASPTDKTYERQRRAGRTLEAIFARQPDHPGLAHYIIHAYDHPPLAARAADAAGRYASIAPAAAHALHMPSHTFTRVGEWAASVETNRRSVAAAERAGSIAEALHASDYMVYAELQRRRLDSAMAVLSRVPALAARFDPRAATGAAPGSAGVFALAAMPVRYALERRDWAQAAALVPAPSDFPWTEAMVHFARALGASRTGDLAAARPAIDSLGAIHTRLLAGGEPYWAEQVAVQRLAAQGWLDHAAGRDEAALAALREAAGREDATEKSVVTPGPLAPARELLGELLLELGRPAEALAEFRVSLRNEPNRYHSLDGARRAAAAAGDEASAAGYAARLRLLTDGG